MKVEIKNISISSVLKMSFLTLLTTGTIFFTFVTLMILKLVNNLGADWNEISDLGIATMTEMTLGSILMSSFLLGVLISVGLVFWISILVIAYNFFASLLGGIVFEIEDKSNM
ncbi:MAG: DUF3566 domain-containing protein [Candidatus Marinimicrobia bacterium]|nr:DUF3566 domain-containing protein [Candidatus Neomarinimicrobiota bacterium]